MLFIIKHNLSFSKHISAASIIIFITSHKQVKGGYIMFVCTLHKQSIKKVAALCAFAVIAVNAVLGVRAVMGTGKEDVEATAAAVRSKTQITDAATLTTFLTGYGIEADAATASVTTVKIPRKWNDSFVAFNAVIQQGGLDLTKFKNKKVDRWIIGVPAMSTESEKAFAIVLVYSNEPVGAYMLQKPSGEVTPLVTTKTTQAEVMLDGTLPSTETAAGLDETAQSTAAEFDQSAQSTAAELTNDAAFPTE